MSEEGASITGDYTRYTPRGKHLFFFISHCEDNSLVGWKGFNPSRKHTCTTGDLDQEAVEFSASTGVQKVQRSRSETSGDKNRFFRIVDLTSHTLLQACFCNFRDVSPLMSIYDLSHLECTVMGAGGQKPKMGFVRE